MSTLINWLKAKCNITNETLVEGYHTVRLFLKTYAWPLIKIMIPLWVWLVTNYSVFYKKMAFSSGVHDRVKGARAIAILFIGTIFTLYLNIFYILPFVGTFTYDAVAYNVFSYTTPKKYFASPQWIEDKSGDGDKVLSVFACDSRHCSASNSTEYRFRDSVYLDIITGLTKFEPYDPAEVAGVFISELNYCSVEAYGSRFKYLQWYPYIFSVECYEIPSDD